MPVASEICGRKCLGLPADQPRGNPEALFALVPIRSGKSAERCVIFQAEIMGNERAGCEVQRALSAIAARKSSRGCPAPPKAGRGRITCFRGTLSNDRQMTESEMTKRLNYYQASPEAMKAMLALEEATKALSIPRDLSELVKVLVSQINGCAYCLNMHAVDARAVGVSQQKLDVVAAWWESPVFDPRERAALAWADALTRLETSRVPDAAYQALASVFTPQECVDLTLVINTINAWNRFAVGFRSEHPLRKGAE